MRTITLITGDGIGPEIIKEAEVYNTYEEDYSNNYNYENNNNVNQERENTQSRNSNNTKQRAYNNVDFSDYMSKIETKIKNNWYPPKSNTTSRAVVLFELNRNGEVISAKIKQSSGNARLSTLRRGTYALILRANTQGYNCSNRSLTRAKCSAHTTASSCAQAAVSPA